MSTVIPPVPASISIPPIIICLNSYSSSIVIFLPVVTANLAEQSIVKSFLNQRKRGDKFAAALVAVQSILKEPWVSIVIPPVPISISYKI